MESILGATAIGLNSGMANAKPCPLASCLQLTHCGTFEQAVWTELHDFSTDPSGFWVAQNMASTPPLGSLVATGSRGPGTCQPPKEAKLFHGPRIGAVWLLSSSWQNREHGEKSLIRAVSFVGVPSPTNMEALNPYPNECSVRKGVAPMLVGGRVLVKTNLESSWDSTNGILEGRDFVSPAANFRRKMSPAPWRWDREAEP